MADESGTAAGRRTVLIVDDEKAVLMSLRRLLRREPWDLLLTTSGRKGLELLAQNHVDLVVTDMQMDGMDGATFLKQVKQDYPGTVRVILTGYAERKSVTEAFTEAGVYQLISKPWDDDELKVVLRAALAQTEPPSDESEGLKRMINEIDSLPSLPNVYLELRSALAASEEGSTERVAEVVGQDPAIAARTLRIANSAFFGQRRQVETISRAISLIGLDMIENIVLAASVFRDLASDDIAGFDHTEFWRHSLASGVVAKAILDERSQDRKRAEMAMLAGTLHDLGKLVFAKFYHEAYVDVVGLAQRDVEFISVKEQEAFGLSHMTLGGHLADWWNMPASIVEAIRWHNDPVRAEVDPELAAIVHMADRSSHDNRVDGDPGQGNGEGRPAVVGRQRTDQALHAQQCDSVEQTAARTGYSSIVPCVWAQIPHQGSPKQGTCSGRGKRTACKAM